MPFEVADYVDFYSSEHHAANVGQMFRPGADPLPENWKHLPAGYHGRAGTVVVSGTPNTRPNGQRRGEDGPAFGPEPRLDIEAELGFIVGHPERPTEPGSAREGLPRTHLRRRPVQRLVGAGDPELGVHPARPVPGQVLFATSISPQVIPLDALEHGLLPPPALDPVPLPYLTDPQFGLDVDFEVEWNDTLVARPSFRDMYWTPAQQLAHLTVNGAALRTGDLYASGTVSGPAREQRGSLIELSWNGAEPLALADGSTRTHPSSTTAIICHASGQPPPVPTAPG